MVFVNGYGFVIGFHTRNECIDTGNTEMLDDARLKQGKISNGLFLFVPDMPDVRDNHIQPAIFFVPFPSCFNRWAIQPVPPKGSSAVSKGIYRMQCQIQSAYFCLNLLFPLNLIDFLVQLFYFQTEAC